jgi:transketolase
MTALGGVMPNEKELTRRAVNAIRALTIDATQEAGSGHPGMPMGAAAMGYTLYARVMRHHPKNPHWWNRDRYIQSAGHGSMLQYSLLHLTGYDLSMDELRNYRQWGSKTPGHPEVHYAPGVEMSTGPLGQGLATAVGFALAEAHLAARYNREGFPVFDHYTYVIASDGDIMEGVTAEAGSLAGHLRLRKLIVLYDDNRITLDTRAEVSLSEDVLARYRAYGWHTDRVEDWDDPDAIAAAVERAKEAGKPSIISVPTIIGYGAPNQDTSKVHGSPLGDEGAKQAKATLGIDWPAFTVPDDVLSHYREALARGARAERDWDELFAAYEQAHPDLARELKRVMAGDLPEGFADGLPAFEPGGEMATRTASGKVLNALAEKVPELMGGSADLAGSTKTDIEGEPKLQAGDYGARNVYWGVREHAMAAAANGLALHGGVRPYVGTFLIFSDYLRPSLRLGALMEAPVIYVFSHDSIALGGDGPTHQPVAALTALRAIPRVTLIRPADANETAQAWVCALQNKDGPTALALTRQDIPVLEIPEGSVRKGAYVLADAEGGAPDAILIATGSEVHVALEAKKLLDADGIETRVVSMPSVELFEEQDESYRREVLPPEVRLRVAIEAGATLGWYKYVGLDGAVLGVDRFGASAEGDEVMERYGFTPENVVKLITDVRAGRAEAHRGQPAGEGPETKG